MHYVAHSVILLKNLVREMLSMTAKKLNMKNIASKHSSLLKNKETNCIMQKNIKLHSAYAKRYWKYRRKNNLKLY